MDTPLKRFYQMYRWRDEVKAREADIKRLKKLIRELTNYADCVYVDGWCLEHESPDPCVHQRAKELFDG